jgi:hypothetical protein
MKAKKRYDEIDLGFFNGYTTFSVHVGTKSTDSENSLLIFLITGQTRKTLGGVAKSADNRDTCICMQQMLYVHCIMVLFKLGTEAITTLKIRLLGISCESS